MREFVAGVVRLPGARPAVAVEVAELLLGVVAGSVSDVSSSEVYAR